MVKYEYIDVDSSIIKSWIGKEGCIVNDDGWFAFEFFSDVWSKEGSKEVSNIERWCKWS